MNSGLATEFQQYFVNMATERQLIGRYGFVSVFILQFIEWFACLADEIELVRVPCPCMPW